MFGGITNFSLYGVWKRLPLLYVICFLHENFHFRKNADVSKMFGTNYQIERIFTSEIPQGQMNYAAPFSIRLAWKSFFSYFDHLFLYLIWLWACNSPILWRRLYSLPLSPFSNFFHPCLPLFLLPCYFGCLRNHVRSNMLFCLMILWTWTCQALVP